MTLNTGHVAAAIVAMLFTAGSTLVMWVFSLATLANASAESIRRVKLWAFGFSLSSLI